MTGRRCGKLLSQEGVASSDMRAATAETGV